MQKLEEVGSSVKVRDPWCRRFSPSPALMPDPPISYGFLFSKCCRGFRAWSRSDGGTPDSRPPPRIGRQLSYGKSSARPCSYDYPSLLPGDALSSMGFQWSAFHALVRSPPARKWSWARGDLNATRLLLFSTADVSATRRPPAKMKSFMVSLNFGKSCQYAFSSWLLFPISRGLGMRRPRLPRAGSRLIFRAQICKTGPGPEFLLRMGKNNVHRNKYPPTPLKYLGFKYFNTQECPPPQISKWVEYYWNCRNLGTLKLYFFWFSKRLGIWRDLLHQEREKGLVYFSSFSFTWPSILSSTSYCTISCR